MQDSFDPLTIVFLLLAIFVIWKLRSVLGQRTGSEKPPQDPFAQRNQTPAPRENERGATTDVPGDNVIAMPGVIPPQRAPQNNDDRWNGVAAKGSALAAGLDQIAAKDAGFDARQFLEGARSAYEAIVVAFAQGDRATLKALLSPEVYEGFEIAIADRQQKGEKAETTFVSVAQPEMTAAELKGGASQITIHFSSKLIACTRNAAGEVVDGSPDAVVDVTDVWTFARQITSKDPNWQLVATEGGQAEA